MSENTIRINIEQPETTKWETVTAQPITDVKVYTFTYLTIKSKQHA